MNNLTITTDGETRTCPGIQLTSENTVALLDALELHKAPMHLQVLVSAYVPGRSKIPSIGGADVPFGMSFPDGGLEDNDLVLFMQEHGIPFEIDTVQVSEASLAEDDAYAEGLED